MNEIARSPLTMSPDRDPARVYLARLGDGSRRTMAGALQTIAETAGGNAGSFPWWKLEYQHCQAIRAALAGQYAPATANKMLSALKGVLKEAWRLGYMGAEAYHRAVDLSPVKGETVPRGRALPNEELGRLFEVCRQDDGPTGLRDLAVLAVCYGAGLRRREVARLGVKDYTPSTSCLMIHSKGTKKRTVYIKNGQRAALEAWIEYRGNCPGPLFLATGGKGRQLTLNGLSADAIYDICKSRAKEAGIESMSPHDLRRTAISDMLDAGADISAVQAVAGHSKVDTTARYDRRGERVKEAAAELLDI